MEEKEETNLEWNAPTVTVLEIDQTAGGDPSFVSESDDGFLTAS